MRKINLVCLMAVSFFVCSCSGIKFWDWRLPYMYPVQQGNSINEAQLDMLKVGMTKAQVTFLLGTPTTQFAFNNNQWQYFYQRYKNDSLVRNFTVYVNFDNNELVSSIESVGNVFKK